MKFKTLREVEDYFESKLPEDTPLIQVNAVFDEDYKEGCVFAFNVDDDCDQIIGGFVKRWKSYYV
jgi:hypothetical protein